MRGCSINSSSHFHVGKIQTSVIYDMLIACCTYEGNRVISEPLGFTCGRGRCRGHQRLRFLVSCHFLILYAYSVRGYSSQYIDTYTGFKICEKIACTAIIRRAIFYVPKIRPMQLQLRNADLKIDFIDNTDPDTDLLYKIAYSITRRT